MPTSMVIKYLHRITTVILAVVLVIVGTVWYLDSSPPDDEIISKRQLSEDTWLYITKYKNAGATDSNVYRYYLNGKIENPMTVIQRSAPVLTADVDTAKVTAIGDHVMINVTGKVYNFTNAALYYAGSTPVMPRVDLNATAVNSWK
ncbi:hypothetical protein ORN12_22340 [Pantoea vagans]|uniref:hypothetical protein n=1 Tax=Pantoea vagans TaxID=470934 RepID=UPI002256AFA7|nr:hypothetical protein [Pantoea vagans]MCX3311674.1 hypothetical protein [Pantoea vagans]